MSHTETHFGKLRKVETGPDPELWCQKYCQSAGHSELASYNDNWIEQFRDHFYNKFLVTRDSIYEIFDHVESDGEDIDYIQKNQDGTYTFVMQFYNGGTCLSECLEDGIKKINKMHEI